MCCCLQIKSVSKILSHVIRKELKSAYIHWISLSLFRELCLFLFSLTRKKKNFRKSFFAVREKLSIANRSFSNYPDTSFHPSQAVSSNSRWLNVRSNSFLHLWSVVSTFSLPLASFFLFHVYSLSFREKALDQVRSQHFLSSFPPVFRSTRDGNEMSSMGQAQVLLLKKRWSEYNRLQNFISVSPVLR